MHNLPFIMMGLETACAASLLIILWGTIFESPEKDKRTNLFSKTVVFFFLSVSADCVCWINDYLHFPALWVKVIYLLSSFFTFLGVFYFSMYEIQTINDNRKEKLGIGYFRFLSGTASLGVILCSASVVFGIAFEESPDGFLMPSVAYNVGLSVLVIIILFQFILILMNRKYLSGHDFAALLVYTCSPMVSIIVQIITGFETTFVVGSLCLVIIYITIQSGHVSTLKYHEKLMQEMMIHDDLTGLKNRKAFDELLANFLNNHSTGVIFCNVNRMKETNDAFGQRAGDQLLVRTASILKGIFKEEDVYRLGGDVFVALSELDRVDFFNKVGQLSREVSENGELFSFGSVFSTEDVLPKMVGEAEGRMYEDKRAFYARHPEYKCH